MAKLYSRLTLVMFFLIFFRTNQLVIPTFGLLLFVLLLFSNYYSSKTIKQYIHFSIALFLFPLFGAWIDNQISIRFFFSFMLYIFPIAIGWIFLFSDMTNRFFIRLLYFFTILQAVSFILQYIEYRQFGDWTTGTISVYGGSHTTGIIMSIISIFWFYIFIKTKQLRFIALFILSFTLFTLTKVAHGFIAIITATLFIVTLKYRWPVKLFSYSLLIIMLINIEKVSSITGEGTQNAIKFGDALIHKEYDYLYNNRFLKLKAFEEGLNYLRSHPINSLFGIGYGNYNDRISAIAMLNYYSPSVRQLFNLQPSKTASSYLGENWSKSKSVSNQFFSDILSIMVQNGIIGIIIYIAIIVKIRKSFSMQTERKFCLFFLIYIITLGFFDNWLQYPQVAAIFSLLLSFIYRQDKHFNKIRIEYANSSSGIY